MDNIFVTKPFLPPLSEINELLEDIWLSRNLTNNGKYHKLLEEKLCEFLGVRHISLFANGTLALITALQAMGIKGDVITTPFSFVATTHAIKWNNLNPIFSDIDSSTFNLNPDKVEKLITEKTEAIIPVHVYGTPCDVEKFELISKKSGIKIIYDACHTFNVRIENQPILNFGDLSVMSFHATKVFNTFEGGAIISHDPAMKQHIDDLKNFGFRNETTVVSAGINAKMNEFQAALGLLQLKYVQKAIEMRKRLAERYCELLFSVDFIKLPQKDSSNVQGCYSYFPVLIENNNPKADRDGLYEYLKKHNIFARRYFYPLISQFPAYKSLKSAAPSNLPVAENISNKVLCLPLYPELTIEQQDYIVNLIKKYYDNSWC